MSIVNAYSYRHPLNLPILPAPSLNIEITQKCIRLFHSLWRRGCLFRQAGSLTYDESLRSEPFDARRRSTPLPHNVCDIHGDNSFGFSLSGSMSKDLHPEVGVSTQCQHNTHKKKTLASLKQFPWLPPLLIFTHKKLLTNKQNPRHDEGNTKWKHAECHRRCVA